MCGRFTLEKSIGSLASLFQVAEGPGMAERYNIAPTQPVVVVRRTVVGVADVVDGDSGEGVVSNGCPQAGTFNG